MAIQVTQSTIAQLKALGFSDAKVEVKRRLVASISGSEKTGKSHMALTAPDPIIYFDIDLGTEGVVGKFQDSGKQILLYTMRMPKAAEGASQSVYDGMLLDFKTRFIAASRLGKGTVVLDTATEIYEVARMAKFGKLTEVRPHHYTQVNSEWRDLMKYAFDSNMNFIFINKVKPKWVDNKRTSEMEVSGFADNGYLVQAKISTYRDDSNPSSRFHALVTECRQNEEIFGLDLSGPMFDFTALLDLVHDK